MKKIIVAAMALSASAGAFADTLTVADGLDKPLEIIGDAAYDGVNVGYGSGVAGKLVVSGGTLTNTSGDFRIGANGGTGEVLVTGESSKIEQGGNEMRIGNGAGSIGRVTVTDGATFNANKYPCVGENGGYGYLLVDGGTFSATANSFGVGQDGGSLTSEVRVVSGKLSGNNLLIGRSAHGMLRMEGGVAEARNGSLILGDNADGDGYAEVSGGELTVTGSMMIGNNGKGELVYTGGDLAFAHPWSIGSAASGSGVLRFNAGAITAEGSRPSALYVGDNGTGVFEMNGGEMTLACTPVVGNHSGSNGRLVMNGGTFTTGYFKIGGESGSVGELVANGGVFECTDHFDLGNLGVGKLTINDGGTVKIKYWLRFCENTAYAESESCEVNLNEGGTLCVGKIHTDNATDGFRGVFNWNGGTLSFQWYGADEPLAFATNENLKVNVLAGGAVVDSSGANRKICHSLSGAGALTKLGSTRLTLAGEVALDGGFVVEEGTLAFDADVLGEDPKVATVKVAKGATLDLGGATLTADTIEVLGTVQNGTLKIAADTVVSQDISGKTLTVSTAALGDSVTISAESGAGTLVLVGDGLEASPFDKLTLSGSVHLVVSGVAYTIPKTIAPDGGIEFKDTVGEVYVDAASAANGITFGGNATVYEKDSSWSQNQTYAQKYIEINGATNNFIFTCGNWTTALYGFRDAPLTGAGELKIQIRENNGVYSRYSLFKSGADRSGFTGKFIVENGPRFGGKNLANGQTELWNDAALDDGKNMKNGTLVLCNDRDESEADDTPETKMAPRFSLWSDNVSTPPVHVYGMLETSGAHPELITLSSRNNGDITSTLYVGDSGADGTFAGTLTNAYFTSNSEMTVKNWNIVKRGTGTWTLTGAVANGGSITVASGAVDFRSGIDNVSTLVVKNGASIGAYGELKLPESTTFETGSKLNVAVGTVIDGMIDLASVTLAIVNEADYAPAAGAELLRVSGGINNFDRDKIQTENLPLGRNKEIGRVLKLVGNDDGSQSIVYGEWRSGLVIMIR